MSTRPISFAVVALVVGAFGFGAAPGCSSETIKDDHDGAAGTSGSSGTGGTAGTAGSDGGDGSTNEDCFTNPTTHEQIINACTTSERIDKKPNLPRLLPDGTLPPLP